MSLWFCQGLSELIGCDPNGMMANEGDAALNGFSQIGKNSNSLVVFLRPPQWSLPPWRIGLPNSVTAYGDCL